MEKQAPDLANPRMASNPPVRPPVSMRQVLAIPGFRKLWLAQMVSMFGDFLALYAVLSEMSFRMHASARGITLVTVFFLMPLAIVGPVAGVFVDRWDAKRTMIASDFTRAVLTLGLVVAGAPWQIYAVFFAISTFSSFFNPAQSVAMPQIVPLPQLMSANAVTQQTLQLIRIVSPAVAGALAGWAGPSSCYYLDSASFLFSGIMISSIAIPARAAHAEKQLGSVLGDLFSGTRFILTHTVIAFVILSIAAGTFAISAFGSLTAVYVRDVLHGGSYLFGGMGSMIGGGMLAAGFAVPHLARRVSNPAYLISVGILLCGLFIALIARVGNPVVALAGCAGIGIGVSLLIIPAMTLMQGQVPQEMRGRVSSSSLSLIALTQGIALLFAGDFASRFGIVTVFYGSAAMLVVIAVVGTIRLRRLE
ncbi:MAG TPA: MFS transporter [Bryobacteraceae bacterium]|nr:MFS transporter [Bryobacteraceae bacterium]